ncbi:hypothetical protein BpHYR1_022618 [Brachionus plicatilis]|uniref:Uncharacterized protein n=1 Tax=Brachionus plicatilis TaxID=10195 RepID=A0A3M7RXL9_BRAPC|nr:hypothetical protein BpHYR1_022618 [Brachionus plicatilis]
MKPNKQILSGFTFSYFQKSCKQKKKKKQLGSNYTSCVGYSMYLDSKPLLYSSTSLTVNGIDISHTLTYLSLYSKIRFETELKLGTHLLHDKKAHLINFCTPRSFVSLNKFKE